MEIEDKNMDYERLSVFCICSIDMMSAVNVWSGHVPVLPALIKQTSS